VTAVATTAEERFIAIDAPGEQLVGVLTNPTAPATGTVIVLLSGRSGVSSVGRSRLFVVLARNLAALGYHVMRFDYRGTGDSTGVEQPWSMTAPFLADVEAVVGWLEAEGFERIMLMGTCGGARLALHAAPTTPGIAGVALFSPLVRDYTKGERTDALPVTDVARRAFRLRTLTGLRDEHTRTRYLTIARRRLRLLRRRGPRSDRRPFEWVSGTVVRDLERLARHGVPVLAFFGSEDTTLVDWRRGEDGPLGRVLAEAGDTVRVEVVPGKYHTLPATEAQSALLAALERWLPDVA
jgi:pimeloyl-ACP methyl ester carboxylesterase